MPVVLDLFLSKIAMPVQLVMTLRMQLVDSGGKLNVPQSVRRRLSSWRAKEVIETAACNVLVVDLLST